MKSIDEILQIHKEIMQESPEHEILPAVIGIKPDGTEIPTMLRPIELEGDVMDLLASYIHAVERRGADRVYVIYTGWTKSGDLPKDYRPGDIALAPDKKEMLMVHYYDLRKNKKDTILTEIRRRGDEVEFNETYRCVFDLRVIENTVEVIRRKKAKVNS